MIVRVRRWWLKRVRGHQGETCQTCGRRYDDFVWWCDDEDLWRQLTGNWEGQGLRCPRCFIRAAKNAGVPLSWRVGRL